MKVASVVYACVRFRVETLHNESNLVALLVTVDQFKKDVVHDRDWFLEMLRKAAAAPWSRDDLTALMTYGACFCFGTDQVVNLF
jgi:hypothetical protein